jgi:EAL domain-containing protein (putative c-di-GMP-specific phosphodiesterase class I)
VAQVQAALEEGGVDPHLLRLELTERLIFDKLSDTQEKMAALKELGVRFSLDDFGTGFLSLTEFKRLPLDQVKIDKSFVQNYVNDAGDAAVARSVIALGHMFGIPVIAEGVETAAQRDFLLMQGCGNMQGYYVAAPMTPEQFMQTYA